MELRAKNQRETDGTKKKMTEQADTTLLTTPAKGRSRNKGLIVKNRECSFVIIVGTKYIRKKARDSTALSAANRNASTRGKSLSVYIYVCMNA